MGFNSTDHVKRIYVTMLTTESGFRIPAQPNEEGAEERKWTVGKNSGVKWEFKEGSFTGTITNVFVNEASYGGKILNIHVSDGDQHICIQCKEGGAHSDSFLKRLPNIILNKPCTLIPYSSPSKDEEGNAQFYKSGEPKYNCGIAIRQEGTEGTVKNFFYDKDSKEYLHGYPQVNPNDPEKKESYFWPAYFGKVASFLKKYMETHVSPKFQDNQTVGQTQETNAYKSYKASDMAGQANKEFEAEHENTNSAPPPPPSDIPPPPDDGDDLPF